MRNELSYNSISGLYSIRAKRDQVKGPAKNPPASSVNRPPLRMSVSNSKLGRGPGEK